MSLAIGPQSGTLCVSTRGGVLLGLSTSNPKHQPRWRLKLPYFATNIAFVDDDRRVLVTTFDRKLHLWDCESKSLAHTFIFNVASAAFIHLSPSGRHFMVLDQHLHCVVCKVSSCEVVFRSAEPVNGSGAGVLNDDATMVVASFRGVRVYRFG